MMFSMIFDVFYVEGKTLEGIVVQKLSEIIVCQLLYLIFNFNYKIIYSRYNYRYSIIDTYVLLFLEPSELANLLHPIGGQISVHTLCQRRHCVYVRGKRERSIYSCKLMFSKRTQIFYNYYKCLKFRVCVLIL